MSTSLGAWAFRQGGSTAYTLRKRASVGAGWQDERSFGAGWPELPAGRPGRGLTLDYVWKDDPLAPAAR